MFPPYKVKDEILSEISAITRKLGLAMGVKGLMNVQFAEKDGELFVIEVNPRASRTVPFLAKATGVPLVQIAVKVMAGDSLDDLGIIDDLVAPRFYAKAPVFPFRKFPGVDVLLGPEMRSTGEVMGIGDTPGEAFLKAMEGASLKLPTEGTVFISVNNHDKEEALDLARRFHELGFRIVGTRGTALHLFDNGIPAQLIFKVNEGQPNVKDLIQSEEIAIVINTPLGQQSHFDERAIRVAASSRGIPCITTLSAAEASLQAMEHARSGAINVYPLQADHTP